MVATEVNANQRAGVLASNGSPDEEGKYKGELEKP